MGSKLKGSIRSGFTVFYVDWQDLSYNAAYGSPTFTVTMDSRIKSVLDQIEDNLGTDLDLASLAKIACLSASRFHRLFKKETGLTPFKFLEELKMEKAHELLLKGDVLVSEIADALNYNDYETFTRAYKKYYGLSPDDLKSIASSVRLQINPQTEAGSEIVIRTVDSESDIDSVFSELESLMKNKGISINEMKESRVFRIIKKGNEGINDSTLIKNKFLMDQDQRLWERLLNNRTA